MDEEEFRWAYSIARTDILNAPPIEYFERVVYAKEALKDLQARYPDIPFGIFARGDQLFQGIPEIHEFLH